MQKKFIQAAAQRFHYHERSFSSLMDYGFALNHIAFQIKEEEIDEYIARIKDMGAEFKQERRRVAGEGSSIYFYDFDNHLFELHTGTLNERLACYVTR